MESFSMDHSIDISADNINYHLHDHNRYEILLFISGNSQFNAEGHLYDLHPYDLVFTSRNELHRIVHLSPEKYERYNISFTADFFAMNDCLKYANTFENKIPGANNYISADVVIASGMLDVIKKMCKYYQEGELIVAKCALIELLYMMSAATPLISKAAGNSAYIQNIVAYINNNLTEDLSLNALSRRFHISVSHISAMFKKYMKTSPKKYITHKRLLYAKELYSDGKTLLEASIEAGFSNYSTFYRMYVDEFEEAPRINLTKEPH